MNSFDLKLVDLFTESPVADSTFVWPFDADFVCILSNIMWITERGMGSHPSTGGCISIMDASHYPVMIGGTG